MHQPPDAGGAAGLDHVPRSLDVDALELSRRLVEAVQRGDVEGRVAAGQRALQTGAVAELDELVANLGPALAQLARDVRADEPGRSRHVRAHPEHDDRVRELPTGTVTLLFTDIEGSTRLLHELGPERYGEVLAEHRRVLREAFAGHGGVEVDTQGDAFFVAFPHAAAAVAAAEDAQRRLAEGPIAVRIGLHTGTPHVIDEGYVGEDVHLGARVAAAGHGGQVLLTAPSRATLEPGHSLVLVDLGEHRLKDFDRPVAIFQLGDRPFPPLKTISNTNLPRPASSFVGREHDVAEVTALLRHDHARLVTMTGPGGTGKTRLAIEASAELVPEFRGGVFWVPLATIHDPELVVPAIAGTLGGDGELARIVGTRELLLVVDNLEQVIDAAPELAALVEACPNLRLLVTSRELLRVRGEVEYEVRPLADADAVALFSERSRLPESHVAEELCRRLDNMPLALELAAARTKALSPEQILERLSRRLDLFRGGRDADPRQETLRATIEWSYELLSGEEKSPFAPLAVFAGGCTSTLRGRCAAPGSTRSSRSSRRACCGRPTSATGCWRRFASTPASGSRRPVKPRRCGGGSPTSCRRGCSRSTAA